MTPGNVIAIAAWAAIVYWLASELIRQLLDEFDQRRRVRELDRLRAEVLVKARSRARELDQIRAEARLVVAREERPRR